MSSRLADGDRPSLTDIAKAVVFVYGALAEANKKVPLEDRATLDALGTSVLAALALR